MQHFNSKNKGKALVVGGSLSGLMTAIALAEEDIEVILLEKTAEGSREGAGLQVDGSRFYQSKTEKRLRQLASGGKATVELWSSIEARLRNATHKEPNIQLHFNQRVVEVGQSTETAWAETSEGERFHSDLLIGADGHRSLNREEVAPEKTNADFAGYLVWMASTPAEELPLDKRPEATNGDVKMMNSADGFLFGSVMKDKEGVTRVGCTWYDNSQTELLYRLGAVKDGVVQHTIQGEDLTNEDLENIIRKAKRNWPEPWKTATQYALESRNFLGTPIKEYYPERLIKGRIALIGDAAHLPAPITASGFNDSLIDAVVLGECVRSGIEGNKAIEALRDYEDQRLGKVQRMVQSGMSFSRSFGRDR